MAVLVLGACVIGLAPILVRLSDAGPAATGFWRMLMALPLVSVVCWRSPAGFGRPSRATVLAGVAFAFDLSFWHYGIENTSVGKATVLANLTPVVVTVITWTIYWVARHSRQRGWLR